MALLLVLVLSPVMGIATVRSGQICDTSRYPLSAPTGNFDDHRDGTVTDRHSNLMWLHCSAGQKWSDGGCAGAAKLLSWTEAADVAKAVNASGAYFFSDWRVPQIHELATIAERQCRNPRINLSIFPETPSAGYWSFTSRNSSSGETAAFVLSFGPDGIGYANKQERHYVRLVRNGP